MSSAPKQSQIITTVLSPAVGLWLRSQVERVEALHVKVESSDRQILAGQIRSALVSGQRAVYQGLHLSQLQIVGQNIRVNLGQVVRGKPLRLLEPILVDINLTMEEADLNASLQAPLLAQAVSDLLKTLLKTGVGDLQADLSDTPDLNLRDFAMRLQSEQLTLSAKLKTKNGDTPLVIRTGLSLASGHELQFDQPQWLTSLTAKRGLPLTDLDGFKIDLGPDVEMQQLTLTAGQLVCQGTLKVNPADA